MNKGANGARGSEDEGPLSFCCDDLAKTKTKLSPGRNVVESRRKVTLVTSLCIEKFRKLLVMVKRDAMVRAVITCDFREQRPQPRLVNDTD